MNGQEICNNGIDDDFHLIDGFDTIDCPCGETLIPLPNPSFEDKSCCPISFSQMRCLDDWRQGSINTSDYYNLCGTRTVTFGHPPSPLPDGEGYVGFINGAVESGVAYPNLKEYIGTCLSDTLKAGIKYNLSFWIVNGRGSSTTTISIYGSDDCNNQPFGTGTTSFSFGCPSNDSNWWTIGESSIVTSPGNWSKHSIEFTPTRDAVSIIIGPDCKLASGYNYYYMDKLTLNRIDKCIPILTMPNVFTPNRDGMNDVFKPILTSNIATAKFSIYNHWGQIVFETNELDLGWDGKINDKESSTGTCFWIVNYDDINNDNHIKKGFFNVFLGKPICNLSLLLRK